MQASCALMNLHHVAMRCGHLPEQFCIGADNTPKETKNATFMSFIIWLLCVLHGTEEEEADDDNEQQEEEEREES